MVNEKREEEDGFFFNGVWVTDPAMDETGREEVNPWTYYGDAYRAFRAKKDAAKE